MSSTQRLSLGSIAAAGMFVLASSSAVAAAPRTPIVFFPGHGTTVLRVTVDNQIRGQVVNQAAAEYIDLPGDSNQEYITNNAVGVWRKVRCHRFRLTDNPGVSQLRLVTDAGVIRQLLADLARPRSRCPASA